MKKGFTLIELLVVIAIIGVLATVVLSSLSDARSRAKNSVTVQSARAVQLALTLYYDDQGRYPEGGHGTCFGDYGPGETCNLRLTTSATPAGSLDVQSMVQEYMGSSPVHHKVVSSLGYTQDAFYYRCDGPLCQSYSLTFVLQGQNQSCGNHRGLQYNNNGAVNLIQSGDPPYTLSANDFTYCLVLLDREVPIDHN